MTTAMSAPEAIVVTIAAVVAWAYLFMPSKRSRK